MSLVSLLSVTNINRSSVYSKPRLVELKISSLLASWLVKSAEQTDARGWGCATPANRKQNNSKKSTDRVGNTNGLGEGYSHDVNRLLISCRDKMEVGSTGFCCWLELLLLPRCIISDDMPISLELVYASIRSIVVVYRYVLQRNLGCGNTSERGTRGDRVFSPTTCLAS